MADMKQLRNRIRSVNSTLHLTHAMELVASSKIRRGLEQMEASKEYADAMEMSMQILSGCTSCRKSPWMTKREGESIRLIVIAGDRGLAGGYNANVFRLARAYPDAQILPIGKRACDRYGGQVRLVEGFRATEAQEIADGLCKDYLEGEYDQLGILFTRYRSMMEQIALIRWVLPFEMRSNSISTDVLFEPNEETIFNTAMPAYVAGILMACVRESFASEVAARRTAMDSAGKNAKQMIDDLQLEYNRARQGAITQEITEIVAGGNA